MTVPDEPADTLDLGSSRNLGRMVMRGSALLLIARAARAGLSLIGLAVLARLLVPSDFGVLVVAMTGVYFTFVVVSGLVDAPITRHLDMTRTQLRSLFWLSLLLSLGFGMLVWMAAPAIERAIHFPRLALGLRAMVPVIVLQAPMIVGTAVLRRAHRFGAVALLTVLNSALYLGPAILLALSGYGLLSVLGGQIVAGAITAILFARAARLPLMPPRRFELAGIGGTGWYGLSSRLCDFAITSVDTLAVATTLGPVATGLYSRAYNIGVQVKEPFAAVDTTVRQALAKTGDDVVFQRELDRIVRLVMIASALVAAFIVAARDEVTMLLLGPQFMMSAPLLVALMISLPPRNLLMTLEGAMVARGRLPLMLKRAVLMLAIIAPGAFLGARSGAGGVAIAVAVATWAGLLFMLVMFARDQRRRPAALLLLLLPGIVIGLAMGALGEELSRAVHAQPLLVRLAVTGLLFACAGVLLGVLLPRSWLPHSLSALRDRALRTTRSVPGADAF